MNVISKLVVAGVELGFTAQLPISTNLSAADIREPNTRQSTYTKTITIPATKQANEVFEYAFEVNLQAATFNPNIKLSAKYFVNELKVVDGSLQLLNIISKYNGTYLEHFYNCSIIGETANIFLDVANLFLTDVDLSDLDHTLNVASLTNPLADAKFNPTIGTGYCYPYNDYGLDGGNGFNWYFEHLKPAVFEKEYVDRIFAAAGYTYTSNFLASSYYKHIIIPDVNEGALQISPSLINNFQFYAGRSVTQTNNIAGTFSGSWRYGNSSANMAFPVQINDDSSAPFFDPGGIYNTGTFVFTTPINGWYTIVFEMNFTLSYNLPATGVTVQGSQILAFIIEISTDGGATWSNAAFNTFVIPVPLGPPSITDDRTVQVPGAFYSAGTQFRTRVRNNGVNAITVRDGGGTPVTTGTSSLDFITNPGTKFYSLLSQTNLVYGNTVVMNNTIPKQIKQVDFLMSIIKAENLYIELDKTNPRNYIIEPREDFVQYTNALDWTKKQDLSNDIITVPMGDLDFKRLTYTYKSDKDVYNASYEDEFKEVYGNKRVDVTNDFTKTEKVIDLIFSATPGASIQTNIVASRLYKMDGTTVKPMQCNIRRLYWGGLKNCDTHNLSVNGTFVPVTQYPYAGHVDDPGLPTLDLCFDNPKKLYWTLPAQVYTNNNLFGRGYSKFVGEITDPNSKIVKCKAYLDEFDINSFSFRKIIFIEKAYYFVNKISNYDPQERKACDLELLKLKKGIVFSPVNYPPNNPPPGSNTNLVVFQQPNFNNNGNYSANRSAAFGQNTYAFGKNTLVAGVNASTGEGVEDVQVLGYSGTVDSTMNNRFIARNNALVVSDDGINTMKIARDHEYTTDFTMTTDKKLYLVDATAGNITVTLPDEAQENQEYILIRVDSSAFTVTVQGFSGSELIQTAGVSMTTDPVPGYTTRRYLTNYAKWYY